MYVRIMFHLSINLLLTYFIFIIYYLDTTLISFHSHLTLDLRLTPIGLIQLLPPRI